MVNIAAAIRSVLRALFCFGFISVTGCSQPQAHVTVDERERHQIMAGWEVTARVWEFDKANDRFDGSWVAQRDELAAMLVNEAGIDRLRLEIKSGIENPVDYWALFEAGKIGYREFKAHFYEKINDNADPATFNPAGVQFSDLDWHVENIVLPVKKQLEKRGRRLRLNLAYVDFKWTSLRGSLSHADNPLEYAELVTAAFSHLKEKYGLVPDSLEIIIEPDNTSDWSGVAIGRAIVAASTRLGAAGFPNVEIIAPSTAKAQRALAYYEDIRSVPGAAQRMTVLAYHRYDGAPDALDLNQIRDMAHAERVKTAMLEYVDGGIRDLLADLSEADATAWQNYGIAARARGTGRIPPGSLIVARGSVDTRPVLGLTPAAQALTLIFNAVDRGSLRAGARSDNENLEAVSFVTPARKLVVAMHALADIPVTISGLPRGRYRLVAAGPDAAGITKTHVAAQAGVLKLDARQNTTYSLTEI